MSDAQQHEIPGMFAGRITPVIIKLALPIVLGGLFQIAYNITDTLFVSWIDKNDSTYIAATGLIFPIIMLAMAFSNGLSVGLSSLVARAIGERNTGLLGKIAESGFFIAGIVSLITVTLCYLGVDEILSSLGASGLLLERSRDYFLYIIPCGAFIFFTAVFSGILQGEGKMTSLMISMIIGTVCNIGLDPLFIFTFGMGLRGAALATTLSQGIGMVYLVTVFARGQSTVRIEWKASNVKAATMGQIASVGFPSALSQILLAVYIVFFNKLVLAVSEHAFTAFTLYGRMESLVFMPIFGISAALVTMVGQNGGRGLFGRVRKIWYRAALLGTAVTGTLALFFWLASPYIYPLFNTVPEVLAYANAITWILLLSTTFGNVGITAPAIYQGLGHPIPSIVISFCRMFVFILPIAYAVSALWPANLFALCLALLAGNLCAVVLVYVWMAISLRNLEAGKLKVITTSMA
jgi:putative MATE family efflux protein